MRRKLCGLITLAALAAAGCGAGIGSSAEATTAVVHNDEWDYVDVARCVMLIDDRPSWSQYYGHMAGDFMNTTDDPVEIAIDIRIVHTQQVRRDGPCCLYDWRDAVDTTTVSASLGPGEETTWWYLSEDQVALVHGLGSWSCYLDSVRVTNKTTGATEVFDVYRKDVTDRFGVVHAWEKQWSSKSWCDVCERRSFPQDPPFRP